MKTESDKKVSSRQEKKEGKKNQIKPEQMGERNEEGKKEGERVYQYERAEISELTVVRTKPIPPPSPSTPPRPYVLPVRTAREMHSSPSTTRILSHSLFAAVTRM